MLIIKEDMTLLAIAMFIAGWATGGLFQMYLDRRFK